MFAGMRVGVLWVTLLPLLLSACQQSPSPSRGLGEGAAPVPVHVSQALSVLLAGQDLPGGLTPQSAKGLYVVSRVVYDIEGRPAYLANLVGREETFDRALEKADGRERVYLTGLVKDIAFYGDVFPAGVLQQIDAVCPGCQLGYHGHLLYGIRLDGTWVDTRGNPLPAGFVEEARKFRREMRAKHEETGFLKELGRRWDELIQKSPPLGLVPQGMGEYPPALDLGKGFFREGLSPQYAEPGQCLSWFLWWCTAYQNSGYVSFTASTGRLPGDFGNMQWTASNLEWKWQPSPRQHYAAPLLAPGMSGENTTWGAWDFGPSGLWDLGEYHLIGCGPVSLIRILEVYRLRGMQGMPSAVTLRLPQDNMLFSGVTVSSSGTFPAYRWDLIGRRFVQENLPVWGQMALWPVKIGEKNGKSVYNAWLTQRMNGNYFVNGMMVLPKDYQAGGNAWLADNLLPVRIRGEWLRDFTWGDLLGSLPGINWFVYTQYTWRVNGLMKRTMGQDDLPMVALYDVGQVPNGFSLRGIHYAPAYRYRTIEFWDWASNWVTVDDGKEGVFHSNPFAPGHLVPGYPMEVYLGDYMDPSNGLFRIATTP